MEEEWKDIEGCNGIYQVSNLGRIRPYNKKSGKELPFIMKTRKNRQGYLYLTVFKGKKPHCQVVHIFVAKAFVPNPENKPEVNHKNGIKNDCRAVNLEWNTPKENIRHSIDTGLAGRIGETNPNARLTPKEVLEIFNFKGIKIKEIAEKYHTSIHNVFDIRRGRRWSHITGKFYNPKTKKKCTPK